MRRVIVLMVLLVSALSLQAQDSRNFTCPDADSYQSQFTIIPPEISPSLSDITVSALGRGNFEPVLAVTTSDNFVDCYAYSPEAEYIQLVLPTGEIEAAISNATGLVYYPGRNSVQIADTNNNTGAVVLVIETVILDENHTYQIEITEGMIASDGDLNAYLLSLDPGYQPSLTITDAEGTATEAETADITALTFFGEALSAVSAPLPLITGTATVTVNADTPGVYALVLELQSGDIVEGDGIATVTQSEEGAFSLSCDSSDIFNNGLSIQFPDDNDYTATVLASPGDPVLAVLDNADSGFCYDDTPAAFDYMVNLPSINLELDILNAQAVISPDTERIVFGGRDSTAGEYVLVVEGGEVSDSDEGDLFDIALTPQMKSATSAIVAYVFTTELELDPILTWESDSAEPVICNDAGIPDLCDQEHEIFDDSYLTVANAVSISGIDFNPMLEILLAPDIEENSIRLRVTANEGTSGEYILVLHLVTD